jgi:hypothetical protein
MYKNYNKAIPQLRIVSGSTIEFKIDDSSLSQTSVTLNLQISDPTTSIWFMTNRYIVISNALHSKEFQIHYSGDVTGKAVVIKARILIRLQMDYIDQIRYL